MFTALSPEATAAGLWLESNRHPWTTVQQKWALTATERFQDIFSESSSHFVNEYLDKWPILPHKSGFELVCFSAYLDGRPVRHVSNSYFIVAAKC